MGLVKHRKKETRYLKNSSRRVSLKPDAEDEFWAGCNDLQMSPGEYIEYLMSVEKTCSEEAMRNKVNDVAVAIDHFLKVMEDIDPAFSRLLKRKIEGDNCE